MARATAFLLVVAWAMVPAVARADDGLLKGPWLMDLRPGSIVVMAERHTAGPLHVSARALGPAPAPGAAPPDAAADRHADAIDLDDSVDLTLHEITLRGMLPGTRYAYTVSGPGVAPTGGTFTTPPATAVPFRFAIYGDTRSNHRAHGAVIDAIQREGADFVIHTGDLVADGRDDDEWQTFFDTAEPMLRDVPFVPVIGNHDYMNVASSGADHYRRYMRFDTDGPTPELDSVFRFANTRFVLTSSYDDWTGPSREWLVAQLELARREDPDGWLFVVMHEGPRSSGPHGDSDALRDAGIDRLLRRLRVDLVIAGHDHCYERGDDEGLRYMVSGGGGAPLYPRRAVRSCTKVFRSDYHYVRVDVERDRAEFTALRPDGTIFDHVVLHHDGWDDMGRDPARPTAPRPHPSETDAPLEPWADWQTIAKFAPALVVVSALAWWAKRRANKR